MTRATAERRRELSLAKKRQVTETGCWEWTGSIDNSTGYGQYRIPNGNLWVHRMAYEHFVGPIPDDHVIHHVCRNRRCFNPAHLQLTTAEEHPRLHASPTCIACGADNWHYKPNGWRQCRPCRAQRERQRLKRKRS